jgi:hypothetical protein
MGRYHSRINGVIAASVFVLTFICYFILLSPTFSFWDCGEYVAAGSSLGIPHPPGNPLYVMISRVASLAFWFFKDPGFRINLITPLTGSLAIMLAYLSIVRILQSVLVFGEKKWSRPLVYIGAIVGSLFAAFGNTMLFCTVEAEVNTPLLLPVMLCTWLAIVWYQSKSPHRDRLLLLIVYISFLGIGIHMYSMITLIPILLLIVLTDREKLKDWRLWLTAGAMGLVMYDVSLFIWVGTATVLITLAGSLIQTGNKPKWQFCFLIALVAFMGFSAHLYIPIRSALNPSLDENHPATVESLSQYLDRKQYVSESMVSRMFWRRGSWSHQFGIEGHMGFGGFLLTQFFRLSPDDASVNFLSDFTSGTAKLTIYLIPLGLMLYAWYYLFRKSRRLAIFLIALTLITTVGLVLYLNFADGTRPERSEYLSWLHYGKQGSMPVVQREVRVRDYFFIAGFVFYGMWLGIAGAAALSALFTYGNRFARIAIAPVLAVLFAVSPALPMSQNFAINDRRNEYIAYDYAYNLLMSCDRNAILFTGGDNDTFPLWALQDAFGIRRDVRIVILSYLNTPWFAKQLKDREPKVPIDMTDTQIDNLSYSANGFESPVEYKLPHAGISVVLPSRQQHGVFYIQDKLVLNIVDANAWQKPLYFANSVSPESFMGLDRYMSQEGLVYRVMPGPVPDSLKLNVEKTEKLMDSVYHFRNLTSWRVRNDEALHMTARNYAILDAQIALEMRNRVQAHSQALGAGHSASDSTKEKTAVEEDLQHGLRRLDHGKKIVPWDSTEPLVRYELLMSAGRQTAAQEVLQKAIEKDPGNPMFQQYLRQNGKG